MAEDADDLELAAATRVDWIIETASTKDVAHRAQAELGRRGVSMDDEGDRVTAEEWLAEHDRTMAAEDPHRPITEADIREDTETDTREDTAEGGQVDRTEDIEAATEHDTRADTQEDSGPGAEDTAEDMSATPAHLSTLVETDAAVAAARLAANEMADRRSTEQAWRQAEASHRAEAEQAAREQAWRDADRREAEQATQAAADAPDVLAL